MASGMGRKVRTGVAAAVIAIAASLGPLAAAGAAHQRAKPRIKATEAGYFGSATVTWHLSVFVYSDLGPAAGNRVTVCLDGVCKRARGHNAHLSWYSVSFKLSHGLRMGDSVRFTASASDTAGTTKVRVADPLLCMHNNGSTPQG